MGRQMLAVLGLGWCAVSGCGSETEMKPVPRDDVEPRVEAWLAEMTLEEKVAQMHGTELDSRLLYLTSDNVRLGIPAFAMVDGPRGVRAAGTATTFPVGMLRGTTWDPDLERRVGEVMGAETAAKGGNVLLAPTVNLLRHPRWGRAQETYGEDPRHMGAMGVAFVEGAQRYVATTAKHYALNSIENSRFTVSVQVAERTLREMYLPHFKQLVEANVAGVMTAYNRVNGQYCAENFHLVREILKDEWGFRGFVVSDWILGTRSTVPSALAGLDIEMPTGVHYGLELVAAVERGEVPISVIDDAVRRILRKKIEFVVDVPPPPSLEVVESSEHTQLAREVARRGTVLLKNNGVLPLDPASVARLAAVGDLVAASNLGDYGSSDSKPSYSVSPLAGLEARFGADKLTHFPGVTFASADRDAIAAADAAIVVVGLTGQEEGELIPGSSGGDRAGLLLSPEHDALLTELVGLNPNTIVILEGSGPIVPGAWLDSAAALLMAFYPGQEGGHALAELLAGDAAPSGKLPVTFPRADTQLPPFVNDQDEVEYDYYHGYFFVDRHGHEPAFPFGFGLSYTTFSFDALRLGAEPLSAGRRLAVEVDVTNRGARAGDEVVQLYAGAESPSVDRPVRWLVGFARVSLEPGETASVKLEVSADDLEVWDEPAGAFRSDPGQYRLWAGSSSRDLPLEGSFSVVR